ncbi:MAG: MarR family transcriptional regulator [Bacteroidota bacterium]
MADNDFAVLIILRRSENSYELTPKELMNSVLITSGSMTDLLERLIRLGLIYRKKDDRDKRIKRVGSTNKGIALINKDIQERFQEAKEPISGLSSTEGEQLARLLQKLLLSLDNNS